MAGQGAGNNRGQAAGGGRFVKFTHGAAQRIAKAVRVVEGGDRNQPGITFDHPVLFRQPSAFTLALYPNTNSWLKGTTSNVLIVTANTATVVFSGITATAFNRFALISGFTGSTANTTVGVLLKMDKINGAWWVTNAEV